MVAMLMKLYPWFDIVKGHPVAKAAMHALQLQVQLAMDRQGVLYHAGSVMEALLAFYLAENSGKVARAASRAVPIE